VYDESQTDLERGRSNLGMNEQRPSFPAPNPPAKAVFGQIGRGLSLTAIGVVLMLVLLRPG
jgi:hypothetical protein